MNKQKILSGLTLLCPLALTGQVESKAPKPNIVVFVADDSGMDYGCYGNKVIKTPNIDKLASQGIRFSNAFLTSPQSSPSRTSMMTGMFAHTIGTEDLHDPLNEQSKMIPYHLGEAGYKTAVLLKTHWGPNGDKQFSEIIKGGYKPNQGDLSSQLINNYREFFDKNKDNPFFLWVGFIDPHRPYNREICPQKNRPKDIEVPSFLVDDQTTRRDMADYYDEITRMDGNIGEIIKDLEKRGILDNTIIVFLSDNGRAFPRCKGTLYDTGIQTPLIFYWKDKIKPNSIHSNGLVSSIDLAPTLLDLAGVAPSTEHYGTSLSSILFNSAERARDYVFSERNWHDTDEYIRSIRSEKLKVIYNAYYEVPHGTPLDLSTSPSWYSLKEAKREDRLTKNQKTLFQSPRPMIEIYDLEKDPMELENVADRPEYLAEGKKLAKLLLDWQRDTYDTNWWQKRRVDQNDRITGFPLYDTRPPLWVK